MHATRHDTPCGLVTLLRDQAGLRGVHFATDRFAPEEDASWVWAGDGFDAVKRALDRYFKGYPIRIDFALAPAGTAFQQAVWHQLLTIPFGETRTYADVAAAIGRPGAARAVGGAVGRNPCAIVIPCHRVVGADGSLTGFASGLDLKARLLGHEDGSRTRD